MEDSDKVLEASFRYATLKSAQEELAKLETWKAGFEAAGKHAPTFYQLSGFVNHITNNCKEVKKK